MCVSMLKISIPRPQAGQIFSVSVGVPFSFAALGQP
jgi:hypothetical protein